MRHETFKETGVEPDDVPEAALPAGLEAASTMARALMLMSAWVPGAPVAWMGLMNFGVIPWYYVMSGVDKAVTAAR